MTDAPKRMHVAIHPECDNYVAYQNIQVGHGTEHGPQSKWHEYHIARPGQPCSDLEFMRLILADGWYDRGTYESVKAWVDGDFTAAMEGLDA